MRAFLRALLVGVLVLVLTSVTSWAQLSTAQLSGRVTDESGAVLPGVTVTATQTDTGLTRSVTTDENGAYVMPNLPTGPYRLEAALQGFRTFAQTGIFRLDNFRRGIKSNVFVNAPAGLIYPGDDGFPPGQTGLNRQWENFSPRVGVAWDVTGDGRTALRASYALAYDFMAGDYHNINSSAPPFGNRSLITDPPGRMDDPYAHVGGDPHPIVTNRNVPYPAFGSFGTMEPDINSPRVQNWNLTLERQIGNDWGLAVSYLGTYSDRLWAQTAFNPGSTWDSSPARWATGCSTACARPTPT